MIAATVDADSGSMVSTLPSFAPSAATVEPTSIGLRIDGELTFEEWQDAGRQIGSAVRSVAFCIGDWLIYGEDKWGRQLALNEAEGLDAPRGRVSAEAYQAAVTITGLDRTTLMSYASVCRSIPMAVRDPRLSFEHHKAVTALPAAERKDWLDLVATQATPVSARKLRASIRLSPDRPRIASADEIVTREEGAGHDNYIPHLTRLLTVLRKTVPGMDSTQRRALKADTAQLLEILQAL